MAKVVAQDGEMGKKFVFTTENVTNITKQMSDGFIPKNYQIPWFQKEVGVRKAGVTFELTMDELEEYLKCSQDIHYFAEKYCKIKREDGSIGEIKLRDYQKEVLDLYKNPRVILCASRQIGKCASGQTGIVVNDKVIPIGLLYYNLLSSTRKLTFLEKVKMFLYKFIYQLDNKHT